MKKFIWAIFLLPLISFTENGDTKEETFYYFFTSRPIKKYESTGTVFYTEIRQGYGDKEYRISISKAWSMFLDCNCRNVSGCTGDLNIYPTLEHAQREYESIVNKRYKPIYILEKVDLATVPNL